MAVFRQFLPIRPDTQVADNGTFRSPRRWDTLRSALLMQDYALDPCRWDKSLFLSLDKWGTFPIVRLHRYGSVFAFWRQRILPQFPSSFFPLLAYDSFNSYVK